MAKIVVILGRLVVGGSVLDTLATLALLQHDHDILLITGEKNDDEISAGFIVNALTKVKHKAITGFSDSLSLKKDFDCYRSLKKILKQERPDIVHTHSAKAGLVGRIAAYQAGVPCIIHTYHGLMFKGYYGKLLSALVVRTERWLASISTKLIAISPSLHTAITSTYRICRADKVSVIPLGIDAALYKATDPEKRKQFRNYYQVTESDVAVALIGRLVPIKNHQFFLDVIATLAQHNPKVKFFCVGDGPMREEIILSARAKGISTTFYPQQPEPATLILTSWLTDMQTVFASIDIVVITSINEGTPVSLMEAQAAGKPVVALQAGGIADIVRDNETGYLIDQGDLQTFSNRLMQLITNSQLRASMGELGHTFVSHNFDRQQQVRLLNEVYDPCR